MPTRRGRRSRGIHTHRRSGSRTFVKGPLGPGRAQIADSRASRLNGIPSPGSAHTDRSDRAYGNMGGVEAVGFVFVGSWHGTFHATWNAICLAIWLLYTGAILFAPAVVFPRGWRQKIWWIILGSGPYVVFYGLNLPIGPLIGGPLLIQRYRNSNRATQHS
jgi:hypothetical protein